MLALSLLSLVLLSLHQCKGFQSIAAIRAPSRISSRSSNLLFLAKYDDGEVGEGRNWIEKSFPVETDEKISTKKVEDYNLGISGEAFQTGPLSKRMFETIMSKTSLDSSSDEIRLAFTLYAMDFTAKEATRAALSQNGLEMVLTEDEEDQGMWGDVEAVRLHDEQTGIAFDTLYDSLEEAVSNWTPGQPFDFVARQVPAKIKELSLDELLQALDPDGSIRGEAKTMKNEDPEEFLSAIFDDEGVASLSDLANANVERTESTPQEATPDGEAFVGGLSRGYQVIKRKDLLQLDGTESQSSIMHLMNALVAHGVLLVDLTDGGETLEIAERVSRMWETAEKFFEAIEDASVCATLPAMATIAETGSKHAKVGYANADNGSMKFLETRRERKAGKFLPAEASLILGDAGISSMQEAFDILANVGKDVVRIAVAASSVEHCAFTGSNEVAQLANASQAARRLADELVDDGKPLPDSIDVNHTEGTVGMSPHRLCRYVESNLESSTAAREVFGAHVDSSFVTIVPVAATSGLEVFDEEAEKWYRPELKAKAHWEEQAMRGPGDDSNLPWHCRYVAILPGEYLQLATRDEVPAAVHRVVAVTGGKPRLSAPILLRGRSGTRFSSQRYLGGSLGSPLIEKCDGKTMEEIHDLTQPSSFR